MIDLPTAADRQFYSPAAIEKSPYHAKEVDTMEKVATILSAAEASAISAQVDGADGIAETADPNIPGSFIAIAQGVKILGDAVKQLVSILEKTPR